MSPRRTFYLALLPPWSAVSAPLGIASITTPLVAAGFPVIQRDFNLEVYPKIVSAHRESCFDYAVATDPDLYRQRILPLLDGHLRRWAREIVASGASVVGFTAYKINIFTIYAICTHLKALQPELLTVVGGPETLGNTDILRHEQVDLVIKGEGEQALLQLALALESPDPQLQHIAGLAFRRDGEVMDQAPVRVDDLDRLPFPTFSGIDNRSYPQKGIPIEASRGCIHNCTFCGETKLTRFRAKSGRRIFAELDHYHRTLHQRVFEFTGQLINGNMKELESFCDLILASGIHGRLRPLTWTGNACVRKEMTPRLLAKLKQAGCRYLYYGVESGSDAVLRAMNKMHDVALTERVLADTRRAGIRARIYMIIGFPTESEEDFEQTLDFIRRNRRNIQYVLAGGGLQIDPMADIGQNPERFGIYWEEGAAFRQWKSAHSTPQIRRERLRRFVHHCRALHLDYEYYPENMSRNFIHLRFPRALGLLQQLAHRLGR